jgi:hypothetical protein
MRRIPEIAQADQARVIQTHPLGSFDVSHHPGGHNRTGYRRVFRTSSRVPLEHDPGLTEDFVRAVRKDGLADGFGKEKVRQLFEDLCFNRNSFDEIQQNYPRVHPNGLARMQALASRMCN